MRFLRNFFSSSITFLLIPTLIIYLIASSISSVLLDQKIFKEILVKNSTFQRLSTEIIPPLLISAAGNQGGNLPIPKQVLSDIVAKVDKTTLASDLDKVTTDIYTFITTDKADFETRINLLPYTTAIKDSLKPALINYYNSLPNCTSSQQSQTQAVEFNSELQCKYQGVDSTNFLQDIQVDQISKEISNFPTTLIITEKNISTYPQTNLTTNGSISSENNLLDLQKLVQIYKTTENLLLVAIAFLLILLVISRFKNFASMAKWTGSALFSASLLPLICTTLFLYFVKPEVFQQVLLKIYDVKEPTSLISDNLFYFSHKISQTLQFKSLVVIIIAIVLYSISFYLTRLYDNKPKKPLDASDISTHNSG